MKYFVFAFLCLWGSMALLQAEPVVVSKRISENPTISFSGITGRPELSRQISNFLGVCGWFDQGQMGKSDYELSGRSSGNSVSVDLSIGGAPVGSWTFPAIADERAMAKMVVDALIEKSFSELKVKGFCNTKIAFCAETAPGVRNVYTCDIDGNNGKAVTHFRAICVEPCWTPGSGSICYSKYGKSNIEVIETTVNPPQRSRVLSSFRGINTGAAVSPDGRSMAVILSFDRQVDLFVMDLGSRRLRRLTRGKAVEASPCWSPDGREIAYVSDSTGVPRIHVVGVNGGGRRILPTIGSDAVTPDWSSNGKIVFASRVGGAYTLGVYDTVKKSCQRVTEAPGVWESPSWAPDNRQVVCKRSDAGGSALYVVDTRTGRTRKLIATRHNLSTPSWSPARSR